MQIYIVAVLVSLLLIAILFFALRSTVKRIDYNTKKYFVDKLQDYDYLIDEKQKVLSDLNDEIEKSKRDLEELKKIDKEEVKVEKQKYYGNTKVPKYMDQNLFRKYKDIKEKFSLDYEAIIKDFISNKLEKNNEDYNIVLEIRKKFSSDVIFKIMSLRLQQQKEYIFKLLSQKEVDVLKQYINMDKFRINELIRNLDLFIEKNDPVVYVYTGEKNRDYNYISSSIKTILDDDINEGIKINYKGILYDYSI